VRFSKTSVLCRMKKELSINRELTEFYHDNIRQFMRLLCLIIIIAFFVFPIYQSDVLNMTHVDKHESLKPNGFSGKKQPVYYLSSNHK
jgi:hypothetical protein